MNIAIDLGTSNTRIFVEEKGKLLDEPSAIAHNTETGEIIAVGEQALKMLGKTPAAIEALYPLENGVVAHSYLVEDLVNIFLNEVYTSKVVMPRVVASIPIDVTDVEKRAVVNAISSFGVRRVYLIEEAKAAAMGCNLPVMSPHGCMIANLGGGTAEIAVLSLGGISVSKTVKSAGNQMDEDIIKYVRRKHNLHIGRRMAEQCKIAIGCVTKPSEEKTFTVKGRDTLRGLPKSVAVTSSEIMEAIIDNALNIVTAITDVLEKTPPELIGDIHSDGITLSGGLSQLEGFPELVKKYTGIATVTVANEPLDCTINGCGKAIAYIDDVEHTKDGEIIPLMAAY